MIDVIWLGGTWFGQSPDGVSQAFADCLDPAKFQFRYLPYSADYGGKLSYAESVARGRIALAGAIAEAPGRVVCGGYSQGAGIAGDVCAEIARGERPGLSVDACALIADPDRPRDGGMPGEATAPGYGVSSERPIGLTAYWAAVHDDPITALPEGSPLRGIADITEWYCLASPEAALEWGEDLLDRAKRGRWQRWWSPENWREWGNAMTEAYNYLPRPIGADRHAAAYVELGLAARLAATLNREVS